MTLTQSDANQRRIAIRVGDERRDIVAPEHMVLMDAVRWSGASLRSTQRIMRERSGELLDPRGTLADLEDGDVITIVETKTDRSRKRRSAADNSDQRSSVTAAWWLMGVSGLLAAVILFTIPTLRPVGWQWALVSAVIGGAVLSAVVYVRRKASNTASQGAFALGPAALLAGGGVLMSPPDQFSFGVTLITVAAIVAVFFAGIAVIARSAVERTQLNSLAGVSIGFALIYVVVLALNLSSIVVSAVIVGLTPLVLRALPTTVMHVPPGMFIDFEKHQQARWAVRESIPESIADIDMARVRILVARSSARVQVVAVATCVAAMVSAIFVFPGAAEAPLIEFIARLALAGFFVLALALGARRFVTQSMKWTIRLAAFVVLAMTVFALTGVTSFGVRTATAIALLFLCLVVAAAVVLLARGVRSVYWSRFGDIVEGIALVLSLPAALAAAGIIDAVRGAMN